MRITLELPEELGRYWGQDAQALSRAALEALVLEGVRSGVLSVAQARRLLGLRTRNQVDGFRKAPGVDLPLTIEQVRHESETALAFSE